MFADELKIVIPLVDPKKSEHLLEFASGLLHGRPGKAVLLGVVEMPAGSTLSHGTSLARKQRGMMQTMARLVEGKDLQIETNVRVSHSVARGIQETIDNEKANLLLLECNGKSGNGKDLFDGTIGELVRISPCDIAIVKQGKQNSTLNSILLPVRGGPHAELALKLVVHLAEKFDSSITLLHIDMEGPPRRRARELKRFEDFAAQLADNPRIQHVKVNAPSVSRAILSEARKHDLVVLGAAADPKGGDGNLLGNIPETVASRCDSSVMIVKTRDPIDLSIFEPAPEDSIGRLVDKWFAENTFHSREFSRLDELVEAKERQQLTVSVVLPTLNEEATIGGIIRTIITELMERKPLVDELVIVDGGSRDKTVSVVESFGVPVYSSKDILPEYGSHTGKGDVLWKSLFVTKGDILAYLDTDIRNIHPKFVYGLIGPLLSEQRLKYVKGFYWRHPGVESSSMASAGAGRISELVARPILNLFFPELSGLIHPLSGEYAGRRDVLEQIPFFTGFGVEIGLLLDIIAKYGLQVIAQADLDERIHRNRSLQSLSESAFAIIQVAIKRLEEQRSVRLLEVMNSTLNLIRNEEDRYFLEVKEIGDAERPPMNTIPEYRILRGLP